MGAGADYLGLKLFTKVLTVSSFRGNLVPHKYAENIFSFFLEICIHICFPK